jgi:hypothetical protein
MGVPVIQKQMKQKTCRRCKKFRLQVTIDKEYQFLILLNSNPETSKKSA